MQESSGSGVPQEALVVKQEPDEASESICGVSEAGACQGLTTDREMAPMGFSDHVRETFVKAEASVKIEIECDVSAVKKETESVQIEIKCEPSAATTALYIGHEVKGELVLGPEGPQLRDVAFALCAAAETPVAAGGLGQEPAPSLGRGGGQLALRDCAVRLERSPALAAQLDCSLRQGTPRRQLRRTTHAVKKPRDEKMQKKCAVYIPTPAEQEERRGAESVASGAARAPASPAPHRCDICSKQFTCLANMRRHRLFHTGDKIYCEICNKQFTRLATLQEHSRIHTGDKLYSCRICSKQFMRLSHLNAHELIHTGIKPYACDMCTKKFGKSSDLTRHRLVHTGDKPYSCEICAKQFTRMESLKVHRVGHSNIKPYSCEICSKQFTRSGYLKVHKRKHTNTKPYSCEICSKPFTYLGSLKIHELIHTNTKPHSCDVCSKRFKVSYELKKHRMIHTGEKPYTCDMCKKQFRYKGNLVSHIRSHARKEKKRAARAAVLSNSRNIAGVWSGTT